MGDDGIRFYFSFRSPYAWIATERLETELGGLTVPVEPFPIFPTPDLFPNDPSSLQAKVDFLVQDVRRLARDYSLTVQFPRVPDCDWSLSHAAAQGAIRRGEWLPLTLELFRQRFCEGADLGEDSVLGRAAEAAGVAPDRILADAHAAAGLVARLGMYPHDTTSGVHPACCHVGRSWTPGPLGGCSRNQGATMDTFGKTGVVGLFIFVSLNAFAVLVLDKPSARPFSDAWWTEWFPAGVVWLVFLAIAGVRSLRRRSSVRRGTAA